MKNKDKSVKEILKREAKDEALEKKAHKRKDKGPRYRDIIINGLWKQNPGLCQLLGMCPLLAVTTSASSALGLAIATLIVVTISSFVISCIRKTIFTEVRIPIYIVIIATLVTLVRFYVEAYYPELYDKLGIYLALIVTNCIIMDRAEAFAGRYDPIRSTLDALASGIGFAFVLFFLGAAREILGQGTLFKGASDILGPWAKSLEINVIAIDYTYLIAILPPGGFIILALFIAGKNAFEERKKRKAEDRYKIKSLNI